MTHHIVMEQVENEKGDTIPIVSPSLFFKMILGC
jgi:hypothetical protein